MAGLLSVTACSDSSGLAPNGPLTPVSAAVEVNGTISLDNTLLLAGSTAPAEVKFYRSDGQEITGIEGESFAKITFSPSTIATATDVPDEHFHKTVTAGSQPETGTMTIGYGHTEAADELSFGPYTVTVVLAAAAK
ncbi:MAG: hypothetical protein ACREL3_00990 [Gemmatimonadales bacterium]